jgi:hypothetical protein
MIAPTLAGEPTKVIDDSSIDAVNRFQIAWQNPFVYALLLIVLGIIIGVVGERPLRSQTAHDIGTIIALIGVGLLGLKGVLMIVAPPRPSPPARRMTQFEQISEPKLQMLSAEPASVTENTTRELDASLEGIKDRSRDTQPTQ